MIELRALCKSYGEKPVLRDVNLILNDNEKLVLTGPSGAGKSTLLRCLVFLEKADSGEIIVDGRRLTAQSAGELRQSMGLVFQDFRLFPELTALENIMLAPVKAKGIPRNEAMEEALSLLERVGLSGMAGRLPSELSGGEQQRAAIARALAMKPKYLFFDEPTSALDSDSARGVLELIGGLSLEGSSIILVTHDTDYAMGFSDRLLVLRDGRIRE